LVEYFRLGNLMTKYLTDKEHATPSGRSVAALGVQPPGWLRRGER
jgi:hypothetical protein